MKNPIQLIVIFGLIGVTGINAQELTKTTLSKTDYGGTPKTSLKRNEQQVFDVYHDLSEVYTLDFSNSRVSKITENQEREATKTLKYSEFIGYTNTESITKLLKEKPLALTVQLPFKGQLITIDLVKADLFGDDFKVSSNDPAAVEHIVIGTHYQGVIRGEHSLVGFNFFQNEFNALITAEDGEIIEVGSLRGVENTNATHIIYADKDLNVSFGQACEAESLEQYSKEMDRMGEIPLQQMENEKALLKCVTYFWETSYNLYQTYGSSQAVTNHITSLFNNFQIMYNNENIGSKLNQLYIWTSADPYANSLDQFSAGRTNFNANLATLFSTTGGGGVAWLNTVCGTNEYYKHGFCGSIAQTISAVPNYSWPVNVTTHEVGHNLGSPHTHACSWSGGAIDGCGPAAGYSEGCNAALPSNGGTIMSYCHLVNGVGMNFNLGFGQQPGNLIRSNVNSCITLTCEGTGNGGSSCSTAFEPNETQATAASIVVETTNSAAISTATDIDYFKVVTSGSSNNTFSLVGPASVDFDLVVYNSAGTQIGSGAGSTATETVVLNTQPAGTYYIKVFGYNGALSASCYTIKVTTVANITCSAAFEPNESLAAATSIALGSTNSAAISTTTDNDFFKITTTATSTISYNLVGPAGVDFDLVVYNSAGTQIGSGAGSTATETVTLATQAAGTYYIKVFGYNGANSASCYTIKASATAGSPYQSALDENVISVYPNPVKDKLVVSSTISLDESIIVVTDVNGQIILQQDATEYGNSIDVSALSSGVYFVRIKTQDRIDYQTKFIKQ